MCGIVGIVHFDPEYNDVASRLLYPLTELQHRGKEASGIATNNGILKDRGTPEQVFNEKPPDSRFSKFWYDAHHFLFRKMDLARLGGSIGIGHDLYTTSGKTADVTSVRTRAQPFHCRLGGKRGRDIYFAFNGNLVNWQALADECHTRGYRKKIINDTGAIAGLIELAQSATLEDALMREVLPQLQWSFCIIFYDVAARALYAVRDALGFMPLFIGRKANEFLIAASEDCVFAKGGLNCSLVCEVEPGSIVKLDPSAKRETHAETDDQNDDGMITIKRWHLSQRIPTPKRCIFQFIYMILPYGTFGGRNIKTAQEKAGEHLAELYPADADVVIPVNDSGLAAAQGYAKIMTQKTGRWMFDALGLFRPHTTGRTFMEAVQQLRIEGVGKKHRVISEVVEGMRIVLVDDSVVRGTTMKRLIALLKEYGALEVHVRVASPPIKYPCFYGIDISTFDELVWNYTGGAKERVCAFIGADSLEYLPDISENIAAIFETPERHRCYSPSLTCESFCTQCFSGDNAVQELINPIS